jgi:hypothetical protein
MAQDPHRLLVITAPLSQVKSPYPHSRVNPNRIMQSLAATLAGLQVPFLCTDTHELGEELAASYLYWNAMTTGGFWPTAICSDIHQAARK